MADNSKKTVANGEKSGIIKESNKKISNKQKPTDIRASTSRIGSSLFSDDAKRTLYENERIICGNDYETAILYNQNGERVFVKRGKKDTVTFSKKQISQMENGILTHNHPNGTVPSPEDIDMIRRGNLAEIRACNGRGTYVIRNNGAWDSQIPDLASIEEDYWSAMNEAGKKYADKAAQEGKSVILYLQQSEEDGLSLFCQRHGLEFSWEELQ